MTKIRWTQKGIWGLSAVILLLAFSCAYFFSTPPTSTTKSTYFSSEEDNIRTALTSALKESLEAPGEQWPRELHVGSDQYTIEYTFNNELIDYLKKLLQQYSSDYTSVVVIDNNNGAILAALDYTNKTKSFDKQLTFSATSPAASIFKIITATEVIASNTGVSSDSTFYFHGKSTTLYKSQLTEHAKWDKPILYSTAFAKSNNVIFAKSALFHSNKFQLHQRAEDFGFNRMLLEVLPMQPSYFPLAKDEYNFAELASGLNTETLVSPLHAAIFPLVYANDGVYKNLKLIKNIHGQNKTFGPFPFEPKVEKRVVPLSVATEIQEMMRDTVKIGTAHNVGRKISRSIKDSLDIGGKTGQMTGGIPMGKRDWFVSFARPKDNPKDKGISMAVMIVNQEHWYIRSTELSWKIIEHYFAKM
jgi:cell division protein FtsI/penicillin-binding protein 2